MFMAYGRSRTWGTDKRIIGGLVGRTVDQSGCPYKPNDCAVRLDHRPVHRPARPRGPGGRAAAPELPLRPPGLINAVFADGSVRAIKDTISMPVYMGLSTMAGGEVLSADSY